MRSNLCIDFRHTQKALSGGKLAEKETEFNILTHELVPKYSIIGDEEKNGLLKKFEILPEQLPKIVKTDPVVKALNAKEGDILRIDRKSITAGTSVYYRIVVKK